MLKQSRLSTKLYCGFGVIIAFIVVLVAVESLLVKKISRETESVIEINRLEMIIAEREIDHLNWCEVIAKVLTDENSKELKVQTDDHKCAFGKWLYSQDRKATESYLPDLVAKFKEIEPYHNDLHKSAIAIGEIYENGEKDEHGKLLSTEIKKACLIYNTKTKSALNNVQKILGEIRVRAAEKAGQKEAEILALNSFMTKTIYSCGGMVILISIISSFLISRSALSTLRRVIVSLNSGASQLSSASGQIAESAQALAQGASEVAACLEETNASVTHVGSISKENAEVSFKANSLSAQAREVAQQGEVSVGQLNKAITEIQANASETAKIIKVIDEIAFQTNLLALNAAVEAARAGEAGKGFAVVAEEVRNLAMRSAEAARSTSIIIEQSVKASSNDVIVVEEVSNLLAEINSSVLESSGMVSRISEASQEQSLGIEQISKAISEMDKATQQNAASAEESASASEELNSQTEMLNGLVSELGKMI